MAQGSFKSKKSSKVSYAKKRSSGGKRNKVYGKKVTRRKRAPAKQKFHKRDKNIGKLLHKNIERLAAAKALKNEGKLSLTDLRTKGRDQLAIEKGHVKKKTRTREDIMKRSLENAADKVSKGGRLK